MKYLRCLLIILLASSMNGCGTDEKLPNIINADGLGKEGDGYNHLLIKDQKNAFLLGDKAVETERHSDGSLTGNSEAIIWETLDGGFFWKPMRFGEGKMTAGYHQFDDLYTVKWNERLNKSTIYKLESKSDKWDIYAELDSYVRDLLVLNGDYGLITISDTTRQYSIYETKDGGSNWNKHIRFGSISEPVYKNSKVFYLSHIGNDLAPYNNVFIEYDLTTRQIYSEKLPVDFQAYFLNENQNIFYFAGISSDGAIMIYKRTATKKYEMLYRLDLGVRIFPKKLHVYGKEIFLLVGERESMYIFNHLYRSFDSGKTWQKYALKNEFFMKTIAFYNDTSKQSFTSWIYAGSGQIQIFGSK